MAQFSYLARKRNGEEVAAVKAAQDPRDLAAALRAQGLVPITIRVGGAGAKTAGARRRHRGGRPNLDDVAPFARQLSVMLVAGVSLDMALGDLARQIDKASFANVVIDLRDRIRAGERLSGGMKAHPQVFAPLVCALVRAGEESGGLGQILADLASYLESRLALTGAHWRAAKHLR